jgi:adenylate cyclase
VRKDSKSVRVAAELVDARKAAQIWAASYSRPLRDIFELQDEIVARIVTTLNLMFREVELGIPGVQERQPVHLTDNLQAWDDFLRGVEYQWSFTKEGNVKAKQMFEQATQLDSRFAAAYVLLGWSYWFDWAWHGATTPTHLSMPSGWRATQWIWMIARLKLTRYWRGYI